MSAVQVRMVDVSGDTPNEVAEVIATVLDGQKRESVERVQRVVLDTLAGDRPEPQEQQVVAPAPTRAELAASLYEAAGLDPADGPFANWLDIPEHLRAWNATGTICHVVSDPSDPTAAVCGHELGMLRDPRREPTNDARVCAACNRAIERTRRTK